MLFYQRATERVHRKAKNKSIKVRHDAVDGKHITTKGCRKSPDMACTKRIYI